MSNASVWLPSLTEPFVHTFVPVTTSSSCRSRAGVSFLIATAGSTCTSPTVVLVCARIFWWWCTDHLANAGQSLGRTRATQNEHFKVVVATVCKAGASHVKGWLAFKRFKLAWVTQLGRRHWREGSRVAFARSEWLGGGPRGSTWPVRAKWGKGF